MINVLKGFISISALEDGVIGTTSAIGELSPYAQTYSRTVETINPPSQDFAITAFSCKNGTTNVQIPSTLRSNLISVVSYMVGKITSKTVTSSTAELLVDLGSQFGSTCNSFDCGSIITKDDYKAPAWLYWKIASTGDAIRIWFSDNTFRAQYDEYDIVVVPTITGVDNLFKDGNIVEGLLASFNPTSFIDNMNTAKSIYPESTIKVAEYAYHNPYKTSNYTNVRFGIVVWGIAGNNEDAINQAVATYLLSNSTHTKDEWITILPDVFKSTEFVFVPAFNQYSIPNQTLETGLYSPLAQVTVIKALVKKAIPSYASAAVDNYLIVFGHTYKSLVVGCVGSINNRDGKYLISDYWPDYAAISTSSNDFTRMSEATQDFAIMLDELIQLAESADSSSTIPIGYSKITRDGLLYVAKTLNKVTYIVICKSSLIRL